MSIVLAKSPKLRVYREEPEDDGPTIYRFNILTNRPSDFGQPEKPRPAKKAAGKTKKPRDRTPKIELLESLEKEFDLGPGISIQPALPFPSERKERRGRAPASVALGRPKKVHQGSTREEWRDAVQYRLRALGRNSGAVHRSLRKKSHLLAGNKMIDPIARYLFNTLGLKVVMGLSYVHLCRGFRIDLPTAVIAFLDYYYQEGLDL